MNCSQIEKFLPLFISTDLEPNQSAIVAAHLANCAACQIEAERLSVSQNWLQNLAAPEFSETQFAQMRANVFAQIETAGAQKIVRPWFGWQLKFGMAAVALLVVIVTALITIRQSSSQIVSVAQREFPNPSNPVATASGTMPRAVASRLTTRTKKFVKRIGARTASTPLITETIAPSKESQIDNTALAGKLPALQVPNEQPQNDAPEMLRIEIQTADPNIKIIWLTPKDILAMQTNAATDSK